MRLLATSATLAVATDLSISTPHIDAHLKNQQYDRNEVQNEIKKLGMFQEHVTTKFKEMGLDRSKLDKIGSSGKAHAKWHSDLKKLRADADHKRKHMQHSEAIDTLADKGMLSKSMSQDLHSLIQKKDAIKAGVEVGETEKQKFVRAMTTLNDMYISIDDERIQTLTDCTVTLFDMYRKLYFSYDTLRDLEGMHSARASDFSDAESSFDKADKDQKDQEDILETKKAEHIARMNGLREDLIKKVSDRTLYRFIIDKVSGRCGETAGADDGATFDPAAAAAGEAGSAAGEGENQLLFAQMSTEEKARCHKVCDAAANDPMKRNKAMLDVFSDPTIEQEAERSLSFHARMSMQETIKNLKAAEAEEVHPKYQTGYNFLQKAHQPTPWNLKDQASCGCGSMEDAGCPALLTLIGQELECAKQLVREQEAKMTVQAADDKDELEEINALINKHKEAKDMFLKNQGHAKAEMDTFKEKSAILMTKTWEEWDKTESERTKCYLRLAELESNAFCAIKHIREFMRGLALEALGLTEEQVQDCKYADFMRESGECKDSRGNEVACMVDEEQLNDIDNHPTMEWTRDRLKPKFQSPDVEEKIGSNVTIAMKCPNTISMPQPCNTFLCPLDCIISEFPKEAECTADCGGGFSTKKANIIQFPRNGGKSCPDTKITDECNTHACSVDCKLHQKFEDVGVCLHACNHPGQKRWQLQRKKIAVPAEGKGDCPDIWHEDRVDKKECPSKPCVGDEYCADTMDLVIVYECSNSVTSLGCWFMAQFVVALLDRSSAMTFMFPSMAIGLVRFGNGVSVPVVGDDGQTTGEYYVQDAHTISTLRNDVTAVTGDIYNDFFEFVWSSTHRGADGKITRSLGYNNMGQALQKAADILDASTRATDGDVKAVQKILVLTKGKNTQCTIAKEVASKLRMKGIVIDIVLFSADYAENEGPYKILRDDIANYPPEAHFHVVPGLHTLVSWQSTTEAVSRILPAVCPDAVSPVQAIKKQCEEKALLLHKGRQCGDWNYHLSSKVVASPQECANLALAKGFRAFVFTDVEHPNYQAEEGGTAANCVTHKEDGKKPAFEPATLKPYDNTCTFVPEYGQKDPKSFTGWAKQPFAAGNGAITNHYAALDGSGSCPKTWDFAYKKQVFSGSYNENEQLVDLPAGELLGSGVISAETDGGENGEGVDTES